MKKVFKSKSYKDKLKGHKDGILKLYSPYGPDSNLLLSASQDGCIRAWDLIDRKITTKLILSRDSRESASQYQGQADQQYVYEDEENTNAMSGGGTNRQEVDQDQVHVPLQQAMFSAVCFSENSVYGGFSDGLIISWNLRSGELSSMFAGHTKTISQLEFLNPRLFVSSSLDSTIRLWDSMTGMNETVFTLDGPVNQMKIYERKINAIVSKNTYIEINADNSKVDRRIVFTTTSITSFENDGMKLIIATIENVIEVYDLSAFSSEESNVQPAFVVEIGEWILSMKILDRYLYTGCDSKHIKVWDLDRKLTLVEDFEGHEDSVVSLEFADNMLYSGSFDHSIRSWNLREMESRIRERAVMFREDIWSRKYDAWYKIFYKKKKKKGGKKKSASAGSTGGAKKKKKKK